MSDPIDRRRVLLAWFGAPIVLTLGVLVSTVVSLAVLTIHLSTGGPNPLDDRTAAGLLAVPMTALTMVLFLTMPLVRPTVRGNTGLGLHPITVDGVRRPWWSRTLRTLGLGLAMAAGGVAILQAVGLLVGLVPGASLRGVGDGGSNDTTATMSSYTTLLTGSEGPWMAAGAAFALLYTVLIGPFLEECVYRGAIGRSFAMSTVGTGGAATPAGASKPRKAAVALLAGSVFGLAHLNPADTPATMLVTVVSMTLMGAMFHLVDWCRKAPGSLWPSVAAHVIYNTVTMAVVVLVL